MNENICMILFLILVISIVLLTIGSRNYTKNESFNLIPTEEYKIVNTPQQNENQSYIPIKPAIVDIKSKPTNYISLNDTNGYDVGNRIIINQGCQNQEVKKIYNVANNLLYTDSELNNTHYPGEPVMNIDNSNFPVTQTECILPEEMKYAYIDSNKDIQFSNAWNNTVEEFIN